MSDLNYAHPSPRWSDIPDLSSLLEVTLPDGSTMYVHPTNNSGNIGWGTFGTDNTAIPNRTIGSSALSDFSGESNTTNIVNQLGGGNYAAKRCADLIAFGFDDWYLPSAGELNDMYQQLGDAGSGDIVGSSDGFWSSTEFDSEGAWVQIFAPGFSGQRNADAKNDASYKCRCVRK